MATSASGVSAASGALVWPGQATALASAPTSPRTSAVGVNSLSSALKEITSSNSDRSQANAQAQMEFQRESQRLAQEFNAREAAKNRQWQEYMSNTAHQREVADLQAAGLNPVLSAMGGNGASVTSGATASSSSQSGAKGDVDTSLSAGLVSLMGTLLNNQTQQANAILSAQTQQAIADKNNAAAKVLQEMKGEQSLATAALSGEYGIRQAQTSGEYHNRSAAISGQYNLESAKYNASAAQARLNTQLAHDVYMAQNYPTSKYGAGAAVLQAILGADYSGVQSGLSSIGQSASDYAQKVKDFFTLSNRDYTNKYERGSGRN